ncbi:hypothetical protein CJD36_007325 [Flavipsychrobacter stenotrophus]|uniref:Uncharacterized protein n=1 Tax=Flavipsychrobacter stenotrophus TaxID=2077091 RepID=A0A2S7SXE7_9BACT|nr:hypothetical protein CJD36_007325 [Flavipsychrobacter stenotrophus]
MQACRGPIIDDRISGKYRMLAIDNYEQAALEYEADNGAGTEIIAEGVCAVGYNDKYIIAKQHPVVQNKVDRSVTNYFIVTIQLSPGKDEPFLPAAPLSLKDFETQKHRLGIDDLAFTKVYYTID